MKYSACFISPENIVVTGTAWYEVHQLFDDHSPFIDCHEYRW
jgi:hypothetical protein